MHDRPDMLLLGAAGRNCGKTLLATRILDRLGEKLAISGAKVTTVHADRGPCPRGGEGCGVCSSLDAPWALHAESGEHTGKDTARLLSHGAAPVWWLCAREGRLGDAAGALLERLPPGPVICESNSLREVLRPGLFVILRRADRRNVKRSAREVWDRADAVSTFDGEAHDLAPEAFDFNDGRWTLRRNMTAIVLAGGQSSRMGQDKALLPLGGRTMIEHIVEQLRPHFAEILISANEPARLDFLGLEVIPDREPGLGPMGALASTLGRARFDRAFVVPCDTPHLPLDTLATVLRRSRRDVDAVVPVTADGHFEPLFAVYSTRLAPRIEAALREGERGIIRLYDTWRVDRLELPRGAEIRNVNTPGEYEALLAEEP